MRRRLTVLCAFSLGLGLLAMATEKIPRLPEGVEHKGAVIRLKPGYAFKRINESKVQVYKVSPGTITISPGAGEFSCECKNGSGTGTCDAVQDHNSLTCKPKQNGGCAACAMYLIDREKGIKISVEAIN
jgi:hypothetical protein